MQEALKQMTDNLRQQQQIYHKLMELSSLKQQHIIAGDLAALEQANQLEEQLVIQGRRLEEERLGYQKNLAAFLGLPAEGLRVSDILENLSPQQAEPLASLRKDLIKTTGSLRKINQANANLLQQAMSWVEYTVHLFADQQEDGVYTAGAKQDKPAGSSAKLFDFKA